MRVDAIRERADAATEGPWQTFPVNGVRKVPDPGFSSPKVVREGGCYDAADAAFIAHAREDVPYLLDRLAQVEAERDALRHISRRIRAGWLPHRLSEGSWWWGRPATDDGHRLWSNGLIPSMSVVERMTDNEVAVWSATLHPMAPEAGL